jgi:hypothetical protein
MLQEPIFTSSFQLLTQVQFTDSSSYSEVRKHFKTKTVWIQEID